MNIKQKKLIKYRLSELGFKTDPQKKICISKYFKNGDLDYYDKLRALSPPEKHSFIRKQEHQAIQNLLEFRESLTKKVEKINPRIQLSASEISNYLYCPVSFSIQRTYQIIDDNDAIEMGTFLHETRNWRGSNLNQNHRSLLNIKKRELPKLYSNSIIYEGHQIDSETYHNKEFNITCKPDFIFESPNKERHIIEEKYTNRYLVDTIYLNQKIQLFIYLITIPNIQSGYLISWTYFEGNKGQLKIQSANPKDQLDSFKLTPNDLWLTKKLKETVSEMRTILEKGWLTKDVQKNDSKCKACRLKSHCLHFKNNSFKGIKFPYK